MPYDRWDAPIRRLREAAYWYHAKKAHAWKDEYDYYFRAFVQAFASAIEAIEQLWKQAEPDPERRKQMATLWAKLLAENGRAAKFGKLTELRKIDFHTVKENQAPTARALAGIRNPATGAFYGFFMHYLPGESTSTTALAGAIFDLASAMKEFGASFGFWKPEEIDECLNFPEALKDKRPAGPVLGTFTLGDGPRESFGPQFDTKK